MTYTQFTAKLRAAGWSAMGQAYGYERADININGKFCVREVRVPLDELLPGSAE